MRIIILGAGRVGESVAESLALEQNDITVIDPDPDNVHALEDRLELRGVVGNGIQPSVLRQAGAADADMFVACSPLDETNLVACKVAHTVFGIPTTVARASARPSSASRGRCWTRGLRGGPRDLPRESVTHYIHQLIEHPEALRVLTFSNGRAHLVAVRVSEQSDLASATIAAFAARHPEVEMRIVAVYRGDSELPIDPRTTVRAGDEVFVMVDRTTCATRCA